MKSANLAALFMGALIGGEVALGAVVIQSFGTAAPPTRLGPYTLTPFALDERPLGVRVSTLPAPTGGEVGFSIPLSHRRIGFGWPVWGGGGDPPRYTGDVYHGLGDQVGVTLTLPPETRAFAFGLSTVDARFFRLTADDGTRLDSFIDKRISQQFGFYVANPADPGIRTIQIEGFLSTSAVIGEFYIAVPEPATVALLAAAGLFAVRRR